MVLYYLMVIAYNMLEAFKCDILVPLNLSADRGYATRIRRIVFDIAGKVVRTGRRVILKLTAPTMERLKVLDLWRLSGIPPSF